jgi:DNA-binding response OmpR family regulator
VNLTDKEFAILHHLMDHRGRTVRRPELLESLWEPAELVPDPRMVDVHIRRLRTKLGRFASTVRTVRGQGYRFYDHPNLTVQTTRHCTP